ncbi:MAG: FAD-binding protein, partial [Deltaproteobacteria bacterium]|nr:FAD-binding protein [Deltaproteobacteria bacterium]
MRRARPASARVLVEIDTRHNLYHYFNMLTSNALHELEKLLGPDRFSTRPEDLLLYSYDGTGQSYPPEAVAWPQNTAQVAGLVNLAREYSFPVVPRGSASGLTGGALPVQGGVVSVMTGLDRIVEIDTVNMVAEVEPGVITADFQAAVEKEGLFYPPDPASREFSTLGGNAAENAGGTRAVKYGVTRDYILGLEVVLGTGEVVRTGVRTNKGVVGYDLTRLLVGSEGTLGIITRLFLRLLPMPEATETLSALFKDLSDAAHAVAQVTKARIIPATMEFMDRASLDCVNAYAEIDLDLDAGALLLVETDGRPDSARAELQAVAEICRGCGAITVIQARTRPEAEAMWRVRRAISPALFKVASGKMNEDIVVPRSRIPDMITRIEEIGSRLGV